MATETRSRFNSYIAPGLFAVSKESFKRYPETWKEFYAMRTSKRAYEESGYTSGFGYLIQKPEGTGVTYDARIQGPVKRWVHDTWALACKISQEAIEDVLYGIMKTAMKDLGVSAAATRHLLAIRMLMNGNNTTYHTAGDSLSIFNDSHVRLGGGTWDNLGDAADPSPAALEAVVKNFEAITDHRGKKYDQQAEYVWCGPAWEFKFDQILGSSADASAIQSGVKNSMKSRRGLSLKVDHEITDNRWGVGGRKDEDVGLIWFDRIKPTLSRHGDPETGDANFVIRMRCSNEANDPRQMYMVPPFS